MSVFTAKLMMCINKILKMKCTNKIIKILACLGLFIAIMFVADLLFGGPPEGYVSDSVVGWSHLHHKPATFKDAFLNCYYEGANLASPINEILAEIMDDKIELTYGRVLWTGIHSLFSENDFISAEGVPLNEMSISVTYGTEPDHNCIILKANGRAQTSNCTQLLPYVCFRHRTEELLNLKCGTFDNKYQYEPSTGNCYKLHEEQHVWDRARKICKAEGGYLAVINNEEEANILRNISLKRTLRTSKYDDQEPMFIGLRDREKKGVWSTVLGDPLENVYHVWGRGQPDNLDHDQYCGSLLKTGKLDDTWCHVKAMFMCERDPAKPRFRDPTFSKPADIYSTFLTEKILKRKK